MKRSAENWLARASADRCNGGCSTGPPCVSAATSVVIVPPFTRNIKVEPPTITIANASRNAVSTAGIAKSDAIVVVTISRHGSVTSPVGSVPTTRATRKTPPTMGTARSSLKSASAAD